MFLWLGRGEGEEMEMGRTVVFSCQAEPLPFSSFLPESKTKKREKSKILHAAIRYMKYLSPIEDLAAKSL